MQPSPGMGRAAVIAAGLLWSTSGLFAKSPLFDAWPWESRGLWLAFWRGLFAALALAVLVRRPRLKPAMAAMMLAFAGMSASYMTAMNWTTAANAIWLQCTAPLWVCLLGWALWREPPQASDLAALVFMMLGVGLILVCELGSPSQWGVLIGLISGVCYAVVVLSLRALRGENSALLVVLNNLATAVMLGPIVVAQGGWPSSWQWPVLVAFGVVQIGLPYLLFGWGLRHISSHEAAGLALLEPVLLPLWVWLVYRREVPAWWTLAGGGLILLGLAVRYLAGSRARSGVLAPPAADPAP